MARARIRWSNLGRALAAVAGGIGLVIVLPGALEPPPPAPLPEDVGLRVAAAGSGDPRRPAVTHVGRREARAEASRSEAREPRPGRRPPGGRRGPRDHEAAAPKPTAKTPGVASPPPAAASPAAVASPPPHPAPAAAPAPSPPPAPPASEPSPSPPPSGQPESAQPEPEQPQPGRAPPAEFGFEP